MPVQIANVPLPPRLKAEEVAEVAGISVKTVYRLTSKGVLKGRPPRGMARPYYYKTADVIAWIDGE